MEKKKTERITKKDLGYFIVILVIFLILSFTSKLFDNQDAVDYFSFAGTITSILLAFLAIIYSFFQNSTYENTAHKLENSTDKIEDISKNLENVAEFKEVTEKLIDAIIDVDNNMQSLRNVVSTLDNRVITIQESHDELRHNLYGKAVNESSSDYKANSLSKTYNLNYFTYLISKFSKHHLALLVCIHQLYINSISISEGEIARIVAKSMFGTDFEKILNELETMNFGFIITFNQLEFYTIKYNAINPEIVRMNSDLCNVLESLLSDDFDINEGLVRVKTDYKQTFKNVVELVNEYK